MSKFYELKVKEVKPETSDSVAVTFEVNNDFVTVFEYMPGQYLTLKFTLNGEEVRRSYSLCSSPVDDANLTIGVKRVKEGLVSNHINDHIKTGDTILVAPPDGRFFADVRKSNYKTYFLFAAGSGITPILSILKTVLAKEPNSFVTMLYGNRNSNSIMFDNELKTLQREYFDRFILVHTLSKEKKGWGSLWKSKSDTGIRKGRIDKEQVQWFINEYPPYAQDAEYYICGPGTMIENTKQALMGVDVPENRIFIESFGGGATQSTLVHGIPDAKLEVLLDGEQISTTIPEGKTILRSLLDRGYDAPYSCEGGVCSSCMCKLESGEVHMKNNVSLDDDDVTAGYILSCQSVPLTNLVKINFDDI